MEQPRPLMLANTASRGSGINAGRGVAFFLGGTFFADDAFLIGAMVKDKIVFYNSYCF